MMWPTLTEARGAALVLLVALVAIFLARCARIPPKPDLWNICRSACQSAGGNMAAIVGPVGDEKPGCLCAKREAT